MATTSNAINLIKKFTEHIYNKNCFTAVLKKVVVISAEDKQGLRTVVAELKIEKEHCDSGGRLHHGLTATLIDHFTGCTVLYESNPIPGVSMDIHVSYLKDPNIGDDLLIEAKAIVVGKTISFLGCELKNKHDGTVYAKGYQSLFMI